MNGMHSNTTTSTNANTPAAAMRADSGGWHSLILQTIKEKKRKEKKQQVNPSTC